MVRTVSEAVGSGLLDADSAHERFRAVKHFGSLDALRALAVLAVVFFHASTDEIGEVGKGYLGVQLFFVISGFLITTLLLRERSQTGGIALRNFYARRTLRIFPLYYAVLAVYVALVALVETDAEAAADFWDNLPYFATYTFNWFNAVDPTSERVIFYFAWSLSTEEQFYLVWPQLLARVPVRVAATVVSAAVAVVFVLNLTFWDNPIYDDPLGLRMVRSVPFAILIGVVLALTLHHRRWFNALWPVLGNRWCGPLGLAAAALLIGLEAHDTVIVLTFVAVVGAFTIREDHPLASVCRLGPMVAVGTISYGIYLLHSLALNTVDRVVPDLHYVGEFVLGSLLVFIVARLSFIYFEKPFLALKDRYRVPNRAP